MSLSTILLGAGVLLVVVVFLLYRRHVRRQRRDIRVGGSARPTGMLTAVKVSKKDPPARDEIATRADWLDYLTDKYDATYEIVKHEGKVRILLDFPGGDRLVGEAEEIEQALPDLLEKLGEL